MRNIKLFEEWIFNRRTLVMFFERSASYPYSYYDKVYYLLDHMEENDEGNKVLYLVKDNFTMNVTYKDNNFQITDFTIDGVSIGFEKVYMGALYDGLVLEFTKDGKEIMIKYIRKHS